VLPAERKGAAALDGSARGGLARAGEGLDSDRRHSELRDGGLLGTKEA
jgi:hypothetical protein